MRRLVRPDVPEGRVQEGPLKLATLGTWGPAVLRDRAAASCTHRAAKSASRPRLDPGFAQPAAIHHKLVVTCDYVLSGSRRLAADDDAMCPECALPDYQLGNECGGAPHQHTRRSTPYHLGARRSLEVVDASQQAYAGRLWPVGAVSCCTLLLHSTPRAPGLIQVRNPGMEMLDRLA
jgi:hypothetical protein